MGGEVFWVRSDLDSGKKIRVFNGGGGVLDKVGLGLWEPNSRTGVLLRIWSKISGSLACLCITDSLSHITYVETKTRIQMSQFFQKFLQYRVKPRQERKCKELNY